MVDPTHFFLEKYRTVQRTTSANPVLLGPDNPAEAACRPAMMLVVSV
jgi:hypothetical protein